MVIVYEGAAVTAKALPPRRRVVRRANNARIQADDAESEKTRQQLNHRKHLIKYSSRVQMTV
jgi:hypothetical protein